jgi:RNA polymerase sigma-70 factor, ECF subfamily
VNKSHPPLSPPGHFGGKVFSAHPPYTVVETAGAVADDRTVPRVRPLSLPSPALTFNEVYRDYFVDVGRWIWALGGPSAERDDLVQDVFLIVHRRLHTFDGQNLGGWLYQITRHRVRDLRRLRWFRFFLTTGRPDDSRVSPSEGPEALFNGKETQEMLGRLLGKLPESQRAAFVLFEVEGYSGKEIADLQRVPLNTVWARIHKARAKLAATLKRLRDAEERSRDDALFGA